MPVGRSKARAAGRCALCLLLTVVAAAFSHLFFGHPACASEGWLPDRIGARGGFPASSFTDFFVQTEIFLDWDLPWRWDIGSHWTAAMHLEVSGGWLTSRGDGVFIGTLGPTLSLGRNGFPLRFVGGISPTGIGTPTIAEDNFGTWIQFTSHAGCELGLGHGCLLGYRFQHMSNAGIAQPNPGLNLHALSFSVAF